MEEYKRGFVVLILYFLFVIAMKFDCSNGHSPPKVLCREEEKEALLSFKKGVDDPSNRLSSWVSDHEECCNWEGVLCHNITGHVLKLNLRLDFEDPIAVSLGGNISSSLLHLKHLQYLDLSCNDFGFLKIPKFFGFLPNLRHLYLSNAGFGGVVPPQLGNLSKLLHLDIGDSSYYCGVRNSLKVEDLEWISGLPFLEYLDMTTVNLRKASNWLQVMNKLHSLSVLRLSYCELLAIDPLPHVNFSSLLTFDLSSNHLISSSFDWFADLSSLTSLNLASNNIHGQIPSSLCNMTSLRFLYLSNNNFASSLPDWLFHMTTLEHLILGSNRFEGRLPNDIGNLTSMTYLDLSDNMLEGRLPNDIGNLTSMTYLHLSYNTLEGRVPRSLGECKCLIELDLGENRFSGYLPNELGQLKSLSYLLIDRNSFSGKIPISLGGMSSLRYLNIGENFFKGTISEKHLANLTSLEELDASSNLQLTVQASSNWTPPFQLKSLYLGSCFVGPQFPAWLQTQKYLSLLNMSYAGISSVIPGWFWTQHYDTIDLSHNQIMGSIPNLHISYVYLGSNNFTGSLPHISSDVIELDLSNNLFCGSLSPMLCRWRTNKEENLLVYFYRNKVHKSAEGSSFIIQS